MSINLFALAWNISFPGKPAKKLVLLSLADSTNSSHTYTWPSYDTIAKRCGISRRAVINSVNELEAENIVIREARYKSPNNRTSNAFRLNEDVMRQLAAEGPINQTKHEAAPVNTVHQGSELISLGSEHSSPGVVNTVHRGSEHSSPKPELEPEDRTGNEPKRGSGAVAPPSPPPTAGPPFQPVPEAVKRQKARRGDPEPEPAIIIQAPAMRLLHELTAYWPGEDNAPLIVASLGDNPDRSALARAVELWRASGHKINNWLGICDWYHEISRDPDWTPQTRFRRNGNPKFDPDAREARNRAVFDQVAQEIDTGDWTPWIPST